MAPTLDVLALLIVISEYRYRRKSLYTSNVRGTVKLYRYNRNIVINVIVINIVECILISSYITFFEILFLRQRKIGFSNRFCSFTITFVRFSIETLVKILTKDTKVFISRERLKSALYLRLKKRKTFFWKKT